MRLSVPTLSGREFRLMTGEEKVGATPACERSVHFRCLSETKHACPKGCVPCRLGRRALLAWKHTRVLMMTDGRFNGCMDSVAGTAGRPRGDPPQLACWLRGGLGGKRAGRGTAGLAQAERIAHLLVHLLLPVLDPPCLRHAQLGSTRQQENVLPILRDSLPPHLLHSMHVCTCTAMKGCAKSV